MKKLIFILLMIQFVLQGQLNAIYLSLQPIDLGVGLRYDRVIKNIALYSSISYGKYRLPEGGYIRDHVRGVVGVLKVCEPVRHNGTAFFYGGGFVYSHYGERNITIPLSPLRPVSFECAVSLRTLHDFTAVMRYDFFKRESALDFGYSF